MIINRIYEHQPFCRCSLFPSWSGQGLISTPVILLLSVFSFFGLRPVTPVVSNPVFNLNNNNNYYYYYFTI